MNISKWLLAAAVVVGTTAAGLAQTVGIATTPPGSFTNSTGTAIATVVVDAAGVQARIQPQAGNVHTGVEAGAIEFALDNYYEIFFAVEATEEYAGKQKAENLRVAAQIMPLFVAFMVQKDSDIKNVADLKGKRISTGYGSQKAVDRIVRMYLATAGLSYDDVKGVPAQNVVAAADDFKAGKTDAFVFALGGAKGRKCRWASEV
jgi:TRAP transporter TAXI family solute receptor